MFLVRIIRYLALLILAGLLSPQHFGIFAALYVVIDGMALLQGFGIGHALIYRRDDVELGTDTAFYLSIGIGAVVLAGAWFIAPGVESFYGESGTTELFRAGSAILLIRAFRLVPARLLEKALDFRKRLIPTLAGSVAYVVVALTMAVRGRGAWSLVMAEVASALVETAAYWFVSPWRPKLRFSPRIAREDLAFGWAVLGGSILIFAFRNVDRVTISKLIGTRELGLYAFAYSIANLPATFFVRALNTVLLPSYSSMDSGDEQRKILFFRSTSYVAAISMLYALGLVAFGRHFLETTYGDKWMGAVLPLAVLAVFALFRTLSALVGDLLVGTGEPGTYRKIHALQLAVAVSGLYLGARLGGVTGVATAMTIASGVLLIVSWLSAARVLRAGPGDFAGALRGPLAALVATSVPAFLIARALPVRGSLPVLLAVTVAVTAVYVSVWHAIDPAARAEFAGWRSRLSERLGGEKGVGSD